MDAELLKEIEEVTKQGYFKLEVNRLLKIYQAVFFESFCVTCASEIKTAYRRTKDFYNQLNFETMAKTQSPKELTHRLINIEAGGYLYIKGYPKKITSDNLTQKDIELMLAKKEIAEKFLEAVTA